MVEARSCSYCLRKIYRESRCLVCRTPLAISLAEKSFIQSFGFAITGDGVFDISIFCWNCDSLRQKHRLVWGKAAAMLSETWPKLLSKAQKVIDDWR
jgi:hypothetical protein